MWSSRLTAARQEARAINKKRQYIVNNNLLDQKQLIETWKTRIIYPGNFFLNL